MPDDVGGSPFPDGSDHGDADDEFASVAFDEDFIRSARMHEPTARERLLAAAQARAEAEQSKTRVGVPEDESSPEREQGEDGFLARHPDDEYGPDWIEDEVDRYDPRSAGYPYISSHARWHRIVAWVLAVVMGIGVLALAVAAVYRGASSGRQQPAPPPGNSRVDTSAAASPRVAEPVSPRP